VYAVAFSSDGKLLASASGDRTVKVWDPAAGKRLYTLGDSTAELYSLTFSPSGKEVAAGGADKMLRKWSIGPTSGALERSAFAHSGPVLRVIFTPDGSGIYTSSQDKSIKLWDAGELQEKQILEKQPDWAMGLDLSTDGKRIAAARYDGSVAVYDTATGKSLSPRR
jgi:WD40 repeat protein